MSQDPYIYIIIIIIIVIKRTHIRRATPSVGRPSIYTPPTVLLFSTNPNSNNGDWWLSILGYTSLFSESLVRSRQTYNRTHTRTRTRFGNNNKIEHRPHFFFMCDSKETIQITRRCRMTTPP